MAEIRAAFAAPLPEQRVRGLKRAMHSAAAPLAVDLQTAITLEMLRRVPTRVADRRSFHEAADHLNHLLAARGNRPLTLDSAVLTYLADLANGRGGRHTRLDQAISEQVVALCGPDYALLGPDARLLGETTENRLLRQSCFAWLLGDGAKARGLFYQAKGVTTERVVGTATNPFDLFLQRFKARTGYSLLDHRLRLVGAQPGLTDEESSARTPIGYSTRGERTVSRD